MKWRKVSIPLVSDSCKRGKRAESAPLHQEPTSHLMMVLKMIVDAHSAYFYLMSVEVFFGKGGEEEDDLSFDYGDETVVPRCRRRADYCWRHI